MEFHNALVEASKNTKLLKMVNNLHLQLQAMRLQDIKQSPEIIGAQEEVVKEHLAIIDALSKSNPKLAKKLVEEHIMRRYPQKSIELRG